MFSTPQERKTIFQCEHYKATIFVLTDNLCKSTKGKGLMIYTMSILLKYNVFTFVTQAASLSGWWVYIHKSFNPRVA